LLTIAQRKQIKVITPAAPVSSEAKKLETNTERFFSVELKSKNQIKNFSLTNGTHERVLVEGTIGELAQATFIEDTLLEVVGDKGTLRINLNHSEIKRQEAKAIGTA
jgi:hypothetical protein